MPVRPDTHKAIKSVTPHHQVEPPKYGQGRGGRPWRRLRDQIMKRDEYMCQCEKCRGAKLIAHEVDHIKPLSQGGTDDPSNLRAMNRDCHAEKTKREAAPGYKPRPQIGVDGWPLG